MDELRKKKIRKKDGFNGQKAIVLPRQVLRICEQDPLISALHITDIGFYPKAQFHYRERENGSPQHILIYCTNGFGWANIEGKKIDIQQDQYLIIPKNVKHKYGADEFNPWSIYWVHFKGAFAEHFIDRLKKKAENFSNSISFNDKRVELFRDIYNTLESGYSVEHLQYINMCFWNYLATFCYPTILELPVKNREDEVDVAIRYMQDHIHQSLSLQEIANFIHLSSSHFSAIFKKKTGYSPLEYFNHIKIQRACQFLEFTNLHVKELSYQLGFNDPFYFSRLFSKYMGQSPIDYRKMKKFN